MQVVESSCVIPSVSNIIFIVILNTYIEGLWPSILDRMHRASCGDVSCFAPCYDHNFANNVSLQFSPPGLSLMDQLQEGLKVEPKNEVHLKLLVAVPLTDCL